MTWTSEEIAQKLAAIRTLPAQELHGWWVYVHGWRAPFEGEIFALQQRAATLKLKLSSPGGLSNITTGTAPQPRDTGESTRY